MVSSATLQLLQSIIPQSQSTHSRTQNPKENRYGQSRHPHHSYLTRSLRSNVVPVHDLFGKSSMFLRCLLLVLGSWTIFLFVEIFTRSFLSGRFGDGEDGWQGEYESGSDECPV